MYALGILFHELLTGTVPYRGDNPLDIALQQVIAPLPRLPDALSSVQPLLDRLLAKQPGKRYGSAEQCIDELVFVEPKAYSPRSASS